MKRILLLSLSLLFSNVSFAKASRLKDLVTVKGVRENPIIGYGLVIGLNGSGDGGGEITNTSLKRMFQKLGLNPQTEVTSKNVAAVIVTAKIPPFARVGQKIDVTVSSIGDASSLAGGTLLVTPLKGGDGNVYAVANGPLSIGGLKQGAKFATTGLIPSGASVEREINLDFDRKNSLRLSLNNADFTTAARIERTINQELGGKYANAKDATTIDLIVPVHYQRSVVALMAIVENFKVETDQSAKIIINERTGTIVAGGDVLLKEVAISHGNLTIEVGEGQGGGQNAAKSASAVYFEEKTTLNDLVKALNAYGTTPEDLISIFQALKKNGSIIGDIELI
ncbi:flagellar P-ring protein FlgI [Bacteriovorax sp. BSW11_IV]|uniref:flagellar basal body P-ring protein FlgI n=1 Tax=Bacteriovorax sp. BSW11_IV TaxID=1353529 RepID=UPI000389EF42|nr:flagellar basal body P-ring protein FlgI [Bacteriovorax sp. BSW11_IV]EQC45141.1 flagellar P-ring protein FlgI [Bacteriovorax sp. BSW11_IV]